MRRALCRIMPVVIFAIGLSAQDRETSPLTVQVNPEAHLDTPAATLSFTVNNPGQVATSQPLTITAWVRAVPNQQIHLTAQPETLNGPAGPLPSAVISWNGIMSAATGGAAKAACTSGNFTPGAPQQMIANWNQSGIAKCTYTFGLTTDPAWPAGTYTAVVDLSVSAQ